MNLIGIDFGRKHIGLATSQTSLAEPLKTIPASDIIVELKSLIDQLNPDQIIIGISESQMVIKI